jgi:uncharacterized protein YqjF (DUF2071 family)
VDVFLTAEWRDLVILNYEVDPALLAEYVPRGTEIDSHGGKTYISLVGFRFLRTRLFGAIPIPFHTNFDEINLRFYVRRRVGDAVKRGVVFIREIVPRRAIAAVARLAYGERYECRPMRHTLRGSAAAAVGSPVDSVGAASAKPSGARSPRPASRASGIEARYEWLSGCKWGGLRVEAGGQPALPADGSLEQFITEHYWGYAAQRDGGCVEYEVRHVPWQVWRCTSAAFDGYATDLYGRALAEVVARPPDSAFLADGSAVQVLAGRPLQD